MRRSKHYIICPWVYKDRWTDFYLHIFSELTHIFGFECLLDIDPRSHLPRDPECLFLFAIPQWDRPGFLVDYITNLDPKVKIITYLRDIHDYSQNPVYRRELDVLFSRFNLIISPAKEYFEQNYPAYVDKMVFMPDYFGPHKRYASLPIQENPENQCLLSGATNPAVYPIRAHVLTHGDGSRIVHVPPPYPTTPHHFVGDRYARLLNLFQCCVTDSGVYNYAVNKVFEIPAAGSLLLANQVKDMDECGFVPYIHYIPVTKEDVLEKIYQVLESPERYKGIKEQGRSFVLENHSLDNRVKFLCHQIEEVMELHPRMEEGDDLSQS